MDTNVNSFTARCYKSVDDYIKYIDNHNSIVNRACMGYSSTVIKSRLLQRLTQLITLPYLKQSVKDYKAGKHELLSFNGNLNLNGIRIYSNHKIKISPILYINNFALFFIEWLYILYIWFKSLVYFNLKRKKAILLYGVPGSELENNNQERLANFLHTGPIRIFNNAESIFIQSNGKSRWKINGNLFCSKYPLFDLFIKAECSWLDRLFFPVKHSLVLFNFVRAVLRSPIMTLLYKDFAEHSVAEYLNKNSILKHVVITNTSWAQQFLWMTSLPNRKYKLQMALYSQNQDPILYKNSNTCDVYHPILRHLNVDNIYIWDYEYEAIISRMGIHSNTTVVGPILWYTDGGEKNRKAKINLTLCIFDVTPQSIENLDSRGVLSTYYDVENASLFINDIISAVKEVEKQLQCNICIIMKQKREPSEKHSQNYASLLNDLENNNLISILPSDTSLYELANQSDLSISFPFTSSAYVFSFKRKKAIFYDSTMKIHGQQYVRNNIYFTSGYQQLVNTLKSLLKAHG
jgi:hypothetical protein